jgi:hypothetical protein
VLAAIGFDSQPCRQAAEVDNVTRDWHLPPEVISIKLTAPQQGPQLFSASVGAPRISRAKEISRRLGSRLPTR